MPRQGDIPPTRDQTFWVAIRARLETLGRIARRIWTLFVAILAGAVRGPDGL